MSYVLSPAKSSHKRYQRALRHMEALEPRTLLSATITSYAIPILPNGGAYDSSGALWLFNSNSGTSGTGLSLDKVGTDVSIPLPETVSPHAFATGPNGMIYIADAYNSPNTPGGIDVVDTVGGTVQQYLFATSQADMPLALTVTGDGAVWFVGAGSSVDEPITGGGFFTHHTSIIGRFDPAHPTQAPTEYATVAALDDSAAYYITASGPDSVWVGLAAPQDLGSSTLGTNRVASASYTVAGGIQINQTWNVDTGDTTANNSLYLTGVADGGDGSVWVTMANIQYAIRTMGAPDQIVHLDPAAGQNSFIIPGAAADTPLGISGPVLDAQGNLWFSEASGPGFGCVNAAGVFQTYDNPTNGMLYQTIANADGTQVSITSIGYGDDPDYIVQIDVSAPTVPFSGSANDINIQEDTALGSNTLLATFVAPTPKSAYSAVITWGDNTQTTVTPKLIDADTHTYYIIVSGKSFATQGTYHSSIAVNDGQNLAGTLQFDSAVRDIPLNVTSFTAAPLLLRIVTAVGTFTDDGDLALSTWTATISWGDNTTSTGLIVRDPTHAGRYLVLALHQYRTRGNYQMRLTVTTKEQQSAVGITALTTYVAVR